MSVVKIKHQRDFVILHKSVLENPNLSFKAKGVWAYCMSRPEDWQFHVSHLATVSKDGIDSVYSALKELIDEEIVEKVQSNENGQFGKMDYIVYPFKQDFKKCLPQTVNPDAVKIILNNREEKTQVIEAIPVRDFPQTVNPALLSTDILPSNDLSFNKEEGDEGKFGKHVNLTPAEFDSLVKVHGEDVLWDAICEINDYLSATGRNPYKDYAAAIRNWLKRDFNKNNNKKETIEQSNKKGNLLISREAQAQLRIVGSDKYKDFFIGEKELVRLDTGERISLFSSPDSFEKEMLQMFNLGKSDE